MSTFCPPPEFLDETRRFTAKTDPNAPQPVAIPPTRKLAIVTCMDARIEPSQHFGLQEGDAHVIRNAGGMAKDALRSLVISQRLLGTREIAVFHHTGCGMVSFTSPKLRQMVKDAAPKNQDLAEQVDGIDFLEYSDLEKSVHDDVKLLKESPLILPETQVTGWIFDVNTRKSTRVV